MTGEVFLLGLGIWRVLGRDRCAHVWHPWQLPPARRLLSDAKGKEKTFSFCIKMSIRRKKLTKIYCFKDNEESKVVKKTSKSSLRSAESARAGKRAKKVARRASTTLTNEAKKKNDKNNKFAWLLKRNGKLKSWKSLGQFMRGRVEGGRAIKVNLEATFRALSASRGLLSACLIKGTCEQIFAPDGEPVPIKKYEKKRRRRRRQIKTTSS